MDSISDVLSQDHVVCDSLFAETEASVARGQWPQAEAGFEGFRRALDQHLASEEDDYFPAFEARMGIRGGPTAVMRSEHDQMRELVEFLNEAVRSRDAEAYLGYSETLCILMRQHNLKEEHVLYPMLNRLLGGEPPADADSQGAPNCGA
jgi:iron-sulfur cluster repair protein YtfE (RIC family)